MDLSLVWRDATTLVVSVYLATLLVDIARLGPDLVNFRFEAEAGGEAARGALRLELAAPGFFGKLYGGLDYTVQGTTWNRYRGLLAHWEMPAGSGPGEEGS
jgi:hypothetical protein